MRGPKADSERWGSWGKGQPAPSQSVRGSGECCNYAPPAWFGQSPGRQQVFLPPSDCLSPTLFILASCNTVSLYFYIGLYSSEGTVRPMGHGQLGPRADAPVGKDTPENCLKAANGY